MTPADLGGGSFPEDEALLEQLRAIYEIIDPVPSTVIAMGKAAWSLRHLDDELMVMTSMLDLAPVRSEGATANLHVFESGTVSIDVEITTRGEVGRAIGVVQDSEDPDLSGVRVVLEAASKTTTADLDGGRFTFERIGVGLVRLGLERAGVRTMTTPWFDVG